MKTVVEGLGSSAAAPAPGNLYTEAAVDLLGNWLAEARRHYFAVAADLAVERRTVHSVVDRGARYCLRSHRSSN